MLDIGQNCWYVGEYVEQINKTQNATQYVFCNTYCIKNT